jgi:putative hydrolase of HD superfamily
MSEQDIHGKLAFLREAEKLKSVLRSAHTSTGRRESTAEHSWRLALLAMVFADDLGDLDLSKVLQLCILHDLGEALGGDVPAVDVQAHGSKGDSERRDLLSMTSPLAAPLRERFLALYDEYEAAATAEAQAVKALDKLETILQHTQGRNPPGFDYTFNLGYGRRYTDATPFLASLRAVLDEETRKRADGERGSATT